MFNKVLLALYEEVPRPTDPLEYFNTFFIIHLALL